MTSTLRTFYADAKRRIARRETSKWCSPSISRTNGGVFYRDGAGYEWEIPTSELRAARKAVRRGAKLLDARLPGWESVLQLDRLELSSCELCVCGQLGWATKTKEFKALWNEDPERSPFGAMCEYLGIESYAPDPEDDFTPADFGFDAGYNEHGEYGYYALEVEWHRLVSRRLKKASAAA